MGFAMGISLGRHYLKQLSKSIKIKMLRIKMSGL